MKGVTGAGLLNEVFGYLLCEGFEGLEMQVKLSDDVYNMLYHVKYTLFSPIEYV